MIMITRSAELLFVAFCRAIAITPLCLSMCVHIYSIAEIRSRVLLWVSDFISHRINMFYSHQLLARKTPLGQIWIAATLHSKIHRRKLDKLDIIKICKELLYPAVPMALRLSGILMSGVVNVYERKVQLLLDDANRLLLEINRARKARKAKAATSDPTSPRRRKRKRRSQANYDESITFAKNCDGDLGETEQDFQFTSHIDMRLDSIGEPHLNLNPQEHPNQEYDQVDVADITLCDNYESYRPNSTMFGQFERFDVDGDEETRFAAENIDIPSSYIPMPPQDTEPDEVQELHHGEQPEQPFNERNEAKQEDAIRQRPGQRRARRPKAVVMDYGQTIIPGKRYQSWLDDPSDIVSRERRNRRYRKNLRLRSMSKKTKLPFVVLADDLFAQNKEVYLAPALLEMFVTSSQHSDNSPSGRISDPMPPPPSSPPPDRVHFMEPTEDLFQDFHSRADSLSKNDFIEKQRASEQKDKMAHNIFMEELPSSLQQTGLGVKEVNGVNASSTNVMMIPAHYGDEIRLIPSSESGHDEISSIPSSESSHGFVPHNSEVNPGRSSKKRHVSDAMNTGIGLEPVPEDIPCQYPEARQSEDNPGRSSKKRHVSDAMNTGIGLEPVPEDLSCQYPEPSFQLGKQSEHGLTLETGPTQTQKQPISNQPLDHITDSTSMHSNAHFDTPGSAEEESLNKLAVGMNQNEAARLFYQTCVLASRGDIKVEQKESYGDILFSRCAKM